MGLFCSLAIWFWCMVPQCDSEIDSWFNKKKEGHYILALTPVHSASLTPILYPLSCKWTITDSKWTCLDEDHCLTNRKKEEKVCESYLFKFTALTCMKTMKWKCNLLMLYDDFCKNRTWGKGKKSGVLHSCGVNVMSPTEENSLSAAVLVPNPSTLLSKTRTGVWN